MFVFFGRQLSAMQVSPDRPLGLLDLSDDILEKILFLTEEELAFIELEHCSISLVCRRLREVSKKSYAVLFDFLKSTQRSRVVSDSIDYAGLSHEVSSSYNTLSKLYISMAKQLQLSEEKPLVFNLLDQKVYIDMCEKLEVIKNHDLVKIWPRLYEAFSQQAGGLAVGVSVDDVEVQEVRECLSCPGNQAAISMVKSLDLNNLGLNSLPFEVSVFVNLKTLNLDENQLKFIKIPDTLVNLEELNLDFNKLLLIKIPDELVSLKSLHLAKNRLESIEIPDTLVNLERLALDGNFLRSVRMSFFISIKTNITPEAVSVFVWLDQKELIRAFKFSLFIFFARNLLLLINWEEGCRVSPLSYDQMLMVFVGSLVGFRMGGSGFQ